MDGQGQTLFGFLRGPGAKILLYIDRVHRYHAQRQVAISHERGGAVTESLRARDLAFREFGSRARARLGDLLKGQIIVGVYQSVGVGRGRVRGVERDSFVVGVLEQFLDSMVAICGTLSLGAHRLSHGRPQIDGVRLWALELFVGGLLCRAALIVGLVGALGCLLEEVELQ